MSRAATTFVLAVALVSPTFAGPQALINPDRAVVMSQATGRPILAIAGSTGCVWCKKMAAELATDPTVQESASKFVVLLLDTDDPVRWPRWNARYKVEGEGIPAVFVVRADGEQIYGGNGAPKDLAAWLERRLEDAGTVLDDAALAELTAAARTLTRTWRRGDPKEVIAEIVERHDPENYSAPARQIALIAEQMRELTGDRLAAAEQDLKDADRKPDDAFEAAVTVLTMREDYAELPEFGEALKARVDELEQDRLTAPIFERAKKVVEAENLFEAEKHEEAIAAMRSFAEQADSPAAAYARRTLSRWEKGNRPDEPAETVVADGEMSADGEALSEDARRAANQVRLGKLLLSRSPDKATKYFERAIELAPASAAAAEAKELLAR